ncbi:hypothetical protein FE257_005643 [Aspergillus nanangensis]|uniref:Fe2OG dioxygenase domain-containing protein n=1 Tax=Aspergillus nanangensis TaxID=2582783 RepID=A0AAD4GUM5_ASPNN|nr:hypothetical protein FE257_005643 [Aspergillus nanangensis]
MTLETLDFSEFRLGGSEEKQNFSLKLLESFSQCGFVKLVNHGISDEEIEKLFDWASSLSTFPALPPLNKYNVRFFNLPEEEKTAIAHKGGGSLQRGWSRVGSEKTQLLHSGVEQTVGDSRNFDQGSPNETDWPTPWPPEHIIPGFRAFMEQFYVKMHESALTILQSLELALGIPDQELATRCAGTASEMCLNNYPAMALADWLEGSVGERAHPHTDLGVLTCLFQDGQGGLEMEDREEAVERFVPIEFGAKSEMVVNVSDTLQFWTNGVLQGAVHQVTVPAEKRDSGTRMLPSRQSCPFFLKANRDASVGPLAQFVTPDMPAKYPERTAVEYHQSRLSDLY